MKTHTRWIATIALLLTLLLVLDWAAPVVGRTSFLPFFGVSCKYPIYTDVDLTTGVKMEYYDKACGKEPISSEDFYRELDKEAERKRVEEHNRLRERVGL